MKVTNLVCRGVNFPRMPSSMGTLPDGMAHEKWKKSRCWSGMVSEVEFCFSLISNHTMLKLTAVSWPRQPLKQVMILPMLSIELW